MCLSPWQLAKFMVWLEHKLTAAVPEAMLCDFLFGFRTALAIAFFFPFLFWFIRFA